MRALTVEADPSPADVQPGPHPVPPLGRSSHGRCFRKRQPSYATKCILDDLTLESQLTCVRDVGEHISATAGLPCHLAAIIRSLQHLGDLGKEHAALVSLDPRRHPFPRDRACDQHDLSLVTREHPAAGGRLLDVECEDRHGLQSKVRTGRR